VLDNHLVVVILSGARQTGKTTLAGSPEIGADREYRTMDEFSTLEVARRDPAALVAGAERMTLDEIQRAPQLLSAVKIEVDRDRRPGRFLCTGSANLLLMAQVSESLAGRAVYLDIPPLTWPEIERAPLAATLDAAIAAASAEHFLKKSFRASARRNGVSVSEAIFRGGFPVPALSRDAAMRGRWFEGYAATYLERDLRLLSAIGDLVAFRRFMQAAALRNGALLNVAQLAQDAGIPPSTAGRYLSLLEVSCLVWRVPAFTVNRGKRLSKTPKLLWLDSGLAAHLAGFQDSGQLAESRLYGAWLKSWVGHHLRTWASMRARCCPSK
jgi:predicted AAA+ superfamily ATPase